MKLSEAQDLALKLLESEFFIPNKGHFRPADDFHYTFEFNNRKTSLGICNYREKGLNYLWL